MLPGYERTRHTLYYISMYECKEVISYGSRNAARQIAHSNDGWGASSGRLRILILHLEHAPDGSCVWTEDPQGLLCTDQPGLGPSPHRQGSGQEPGQLLGTGARSHDSLVGCRQWDGRIYPVQWQWHPLPGRFPARSYYPTPGWQPCGHNRG